MMAVRPLDLAAVPIDGGSPTSLRIGETTAVGVWLTLRGVAVAAATCTLTATIGGTSITLTPSIATTGEVTASVTSANLTSLSAQVLSIVTLWWSGTVTDGASTHSWQVEQLCVVTDRHFRVPVVYADLEAQLPAMARACALPSGQTNFFPQCRIAWERLRRLLDSQQAGVKTWLLSHPTETTDLWQYAALAEICRVMSGGDNGQAGSLSAEAIRFDKLRNEEFARLVATVKADNSAFGTEGSSQKMGLKAVATWSGAGNRGYGGPL